MYGDGRGVAQDDAQAVAWYRKAAEQGDAAAQNNLGWMTSTAVAWRKTTRRPWLDTARRRSRAKPLAKTISVRCTKDGHGVAQDDAQAVEWYARRRSKATPLAKTVSV